MSQKIIVKIPVKPHLKKFILYSSELPEPIPADEKEFLGRAIIKVLQETRKHKFDNLVESYTDRIEVILNHDMRERSPRLHRLIYINNELEKQFKEALLFWIRAQKKMGAPSNEACKNFLETLRIEEREYSYDAAYKTWQRFQSSRKNKISAPELS